MNQNKWNLFEIIVLTSSLILCIVFSVVFKNPYFVLIHSILSVAGTVFNTKGHLAVFPFSIAGCLIYVYICSLEKYYGEMILNVCIILPFLIYGFINWSKHKQQKIVKQAKISKSAFLIIVISAAILAVGYYFILRAINTNLTLFNTLSAFFVICGIVLMSRRSKFQFAAWLAVDVVAFVLWFIPLIKGKTEYVATLLTVVIYLVVDSYGLYNWIKREKQK